MSTAPANDDQREFRCIHCDGKILVPKSLPPTTGPCPHCSLEITSPGQEADEKAVEVDPIFGNPVNLDPVAASKKETGGGRPPLPPAAEKPGKSSSPVENPLDTGPSTDEIKAAKAEETRKKEIQDAKEAAERAESERKEKEKEETAKAEAKAAEERRLAEEKKAAAAKAEEERLAAEKKRVEEERLVAEKKKEDEAKAARAEEEKREEERRAAVEKKEAAAQAEKETMMAEAAAAKAKAAKVAAAKAAEAKAAEAKAAEAKAEEAKAAASEPAEEEADQTSEEEVPAAEATVLDEKGKPSAGNKPRRRKVPVAALVVLFLLIGLAAAVVVLGPKFLKKGPSGPPVAQSSPNRELREKQYLESGWEVDAREVLGQFIAAERTAGKAAFSIRGSELLEEMDSFYEGLAIDDSDTPMEAFAVFPLVMADKQRGIFMLTYDQPPVFELNEFFVPLSPLRVQHGVEEPGLLLASVARRSNFTAEPLKVHAIFKRTPDGLRLDWETFVQTKYRTMRDFLELPVAGTSKVFRVIISETVPQNRRVPAGYRTYMVADPAYPKQDSARVDVAVDSDIGQALSILNWRGTKDGRAVAKTATLELGWSDETTPQLQVERFICWEFLGVGGEAVPGAQ